MSAALLGLQKIPPGFTAKVRQILFENKNCPAMRHAKSVDVGRLLLLHPLGLRSLVVCRRQRLSVVAAEPISGPCVLVVTLFSRIIAI